MSQPQQCCPLYKNSISKKTPEISSQYVSSTFYMVQKWKTLVCGDWSPGNRRCKDLLLGVCGGEILYLECTVSSSYILFLLCFFKEICCPTLINIISILPQQAHLGFIKLKLEGVGKQEQKPTHCILCTGYLALLFHITVGCDFYRGMKSVLYLFLTLHNQIYSTTPTIHPPVSQIC